MAVRQIVADVPGKVLPAEKADEVAFARELRMLAAVKLHRLGRLLSGRAAEPAAMSRVGFPMNLGRCRAFPSAGELRKLKHAYAESHRQSLSTR